MNTSMPTVIAVFIATLLIFSGFGINIEYVDESGTDMKADASPDAKSDSKPDAAPGGSKMPRPKTTAYSPAGLAALARDALRIAKERIAARLGADNVAKVVSRKKDSTGVALAKVKPAGASEATTLVKPAGASEASEATTENAPIELDSSKRDALAEATTGNALIELDSGSGPVDLQEATTGNALSELDSGSGPVDDDLTGRGGPQGQSWGDWFPFSDIYRQITLNNPKVGFRGGPVDLPDPLLVNLEEKCKQCRVRHECKGDLPTADCEDNQPDLRHLLALMVKPGFLGSTCAQVKEGGRCGYPAAGNVCASTCGKCEGFCTKNCEHNEQETFLPQCAPTGAARTKTRLFNAVRRVWLAHPEIGLQQLAKGFQQVKLPSILAHHEIETIREALIDAFQTLDPDKQKEAFIDAVRVQYEAHPGLSPEKTTERLQQEQPGLGAEAKEVGQALEKFFQVLSAEEQKYALIYAVDELTTSRRQSKLWNTVFNTVKTLQKEQPWLKATAEKIVEVPEGYSRGVSKQGRLADMIREKQPGITKAELLRQLRAKMPEGEPVQLVEFNKAWEELQKENPMEKQPQETEPKPSSSTKKRPQETEPKARSSTKKKGAAGVMD